MPKYHVKAIRTFTYVVEVEAEDEAQAGEVGVIKLCEQGHVTGGVRTDLPTPDEEKMAILVMTSDERRAELTERLLDKYKGRAAQALRIAKEHPENAVELTRISHNWEAAIKDFHKIMG